MSGKALKLILTVSKRDQDSLIACNHQNISNIACNHQIVSKGIIL